MKMYSGQKAYAAHCAQHRRPNRKEAADKKSEDAVNRQIGRKFHQHNVKRKKEMSNSKNQNDVKVKETEMKKTTNSKQEIRDGVKREPSNEEELHLKYIEHSPALLDVYLAVSDDKGEFFGDVDLESEVINFINEYHNKESHEVHRRAVVLSNLRTLYVNYSSKIDKAANISNGIVTKQNIRKGMLLNIEQNLLKKTKNSEWIKHYTETYGKTSLRSAQDYMALARTPNIIRYAFLGKERLMESLRSINSLKIDGEDPMASFLDTFNVLFDPDNKGNMNKIAELKTDVDYAVALCKIKAAEAKKEIDLGYDPSLIKNLIGDSVKISNGFIEDLFTLKKETGDVNQHLQSLCSNDGNGGDETLPKIKKVFGFAKLVGNLKDAIEYFRQNETLVTRIEEEKIEDLESCVAELKTLRNNGNGNNQ
jgi:hypothetical protein